MAPFGGHGSSGRGGGGFRGEEVDEEGEEGMEDLNYRHLFLNKLMPSMVRTRSFSTINVSIGRLIHRYYEGSGEREI